MWSVQFKIFYMETTLKDGKCIESRKREHIAYLEFANALLKVIRILRPQTEIVVPKVD